MFSSTLVIALRTPRQAQEAATRGTPISPSVFIALGVRWYVSLFTFFSFFTLCVLTCYRAYDGLRLRIKSAMRVWMDGFQVRCSLKREVETAAGGVFAHHKALVVGKARRPFIRLSCRRAAYKPDEADLGKRRFFCCLLRHIVLSLFVLTY